MVFVLRSVPIALILALTMFGAGPALAADTPPNSSTLGKIISNLISGTNKISFLQSYLAYVLGALFCAQGLLKFKKHVDNPGQYPLNEAIRRLLAAGLFMCLPYVGVAVRETLTDGITGSVKASGFVDASKVTAGALDGMIVAFVSDIANPIQKLLNFFCFVMGCSLLMVGIHRLTKRMEEGPKGPTGLGTVTTFIIAGVFFNWGEVLGAFTNTLFNTGTSGLSRTIANIDPNGVLGLAQADAAKVNQVIQAMMIFVFLLGMVAFIRGCLVLRAVADGGQGSMGQALTFLIGGALAVNLGDVVNALQSTIGVTGITFH